MKWPTTLGLNAHFRQGWKKLKLFPANAVGFLVVMQNNPIFMNKTMVSFQHLALGNRHHHWWTLGPLPYNLNSSTIKPNKTGFCLTLGVWVFPKNCEKPNFKEPRGASLDFRGPLMSSVAHTKSV